MAQGVGEIVWSGHSCSLCWRWNKLAGSSTRSTRKLLHTNWRTVKIAPSRRAYILGAVLLASLTICSRYFSDRGGPGFMGSLTLAGIAYLWAIRELFAMQGLYRHAVVIGLILAAVWHVEFLRLPAGADDDVHRYVWDG